MTDPKEVADLVATLREHCIGHPHAKIAWPHRLLHDAATTLETLSSENAALKQENEKLQEALWEY
jgi:regulator of replication initiation timing